MIAVTVNQNISSIAVDWSRFCNADATIDGVSVKKHGDSYNQFSTDDDVKNFFKEIILANLKSDKDKVVDYLATAFHQGGLMYPVSASMAVILHDKAKLQALCSRSIRQVVITTTENGFKVQEVYTVNNVCVMYEANNELKEEADDDLYIHPDPSEKFVIKAGASIDVDFSSATSNPSITVESSYISYGNKKVQSILDERNLGQIIVDFFRNIFGLNSIKDVSEELEPGTSTSISNR